jgi:hypothetical protein
MPSLSEIDATVDVFCVSDFKPDMPTVRGRIALMHRLARRLTTPRGRFKFWPKFGTDIRQYLLSKVPPRAVASAAESECLKDEQVDRATVAVESREGGRLLRLVIAIEDANGPFTFTLDITQAAASLIELQNAA